MERFEIISGILMVIALIGALFVEPYFERLEREARRKDRWEIIEHEFIELDERRVEK